MMQYFEESVVYIKEKVFNVLNMKRIIKFIIGILAVATIMGCSEVIGEGWIVDWTPVSITLRVQDANGNNLLDPDIENSWAESVIIAFQGKTYKSTLYKDG